jgi:hypothetical protein
MKKTTYILGLASGAILALNWRLLVKEGIKISVKVGREVKRVSAETMEDIEDAKAEAMQDLADEERTAREEEHKGTGHQPKPKPATT